LQQEINKIQMKEIQYLETWASADLFQGGRVGGGSKKILFGLKAQKDTIFLENTIFKIVKKHTLFPLLPSLKLPMF